MRCSPCRCADSALPDQSEVTHLPRREPEIVRKFEKENAVYWNTCVGDLSFPPRCRVTCQSHWGLVRICSPAAVTLRSAVAGTSEDGGQRCRVFFVWLITGALAPLPAGGSPFRRPRPGPSVHMQFSPHPAPSRATGAQRGAVRPHERAWPL